MRGTSSGNPSRIPKKLAYDFHSHCQQSPRGLYIGEQTAKLKVKRKNKCGTRPATSCRIVRGISHLAFPPPRAARRRYWSDSAPGSATFTSTGCKTRFRESRRCILCGWPAAHPAHRAGSGGGRNARATGTHSRAFPIFPLAIHPRESPAATSVTAINRLASVKSSYVFGETTLG